MIGAGGLLAAAGGVRAETSYLAGQTLRVLLPSSPGSGTDTSGRMLIKHLTTRLPDTRIVGENNEAANGRIAMLELVQATPDGLTVSFPPVNLMFAEILGTEELPFSSPDLAWICGMSVDRRVMVLSAKSEAKTLEDLLRGDRPLLLACESSGSSAYLQALLLNAMLGCWIRPVTGYKGDSRSLALITGEADLLIGTRTSVRAALADDAARVVMLLSTALPGSADAALPALRDLPHDPAHSWVADLLELQCQNGRTLATTPGTPPERLAVLRALMAEICSDPAFLADAAKIEMEVAYTPGDVIESNTRALLADKSGLAMKLQALLDCGERRADTGERC